MAYIQQVTVDITPGNNKKTPIFNASQYDKGREFRANLVSDLVPYVLDGTELISLTVRKCDGNLVTMDIANTFANKSYIEFVTTEQMCACAGFNYGEITLAKNGDKISSLNWYLVVEGAPDEGGVSESEINNLERQIDDYLNEVLPDQIAEEVPQAVDDYIGDNYYDKEATDEKFATKEDTYTKQESDSFFADEYDATQTYAVGDYRIHDGGLYVCNTPITTPETWDASHWTLTDVGSALEAITSIIPSKTSQLQNDSGFAQIDDSEESASKTYSSDKVDTLLDNKYEQKLTQTLKVGENILTEASVVLGANWSGSIESGLAHSSGSTESLEFNIATTNNKAYLVTFNATNVSNANALSVCIGDTPLVDIYNGGSEFYIGIVSDGGNLIITPKSTYNGTITNLKLREVADEGEAVTFVAKNVNTSDKASGISGFWNVAIGFDNFEENENGSRNVAVGFASLQKFKSGTRNLAVGTFAMNRLESGDRNVAIGADSMWYAKKATDCIALGHDSMNGVGTDIEHNIAIGQESLSGLTTGKQNIGIGYGSMEYPQNGGINDTVSVGAQSGNYANSSCTYIGTRAGYFLKGASNSCLGKQAGAQQNTTGQQNTFVGTQSGIDNTGATAQNPKTVDNSIAIGYQARVTKSNQAMIGSANVTEVVFCGNKKIKFNNDGTVTWETLA